jgi:hypothetical protein
VLGLSLGLLLWKVGEEVGLELGDELGAVLGEVDGAVVGELLGLWLGEGLGCSEGLWLGLVLGEMLGAVLVMMTMAVSETLSGVPLTPTNPMAVAMFSMVVSGVVHSTLKLPLAVAPAARSFKTNSLSSSVRPDSVTLKSSLVSPGVPLSSVSTTLYKGALPGFVIV